MFFEPLRSGHFGRQSIFGLLFPFKRVGRSRSDCSHKLSVLLLLLLPLLHVDLESVVLRKRTGTFALLDVTLLELSNPALSLGKQRNKRSSPSFLPLHHRTSFRIHSHSNIITMSQVNIGING